MKLSIITINYNNKEGLKRTAESVKRQRYADTIDIAISEKDTGIYNAMNKGVKVAQGEFLLFLNSGDWLNSTDVTEVILSYLTDNIDILSG